MKDTMLAVVKTREGRGAELMEVPVPRPGRREVLVKVKATSICGTDHHIWEWNDWAASRIKPPHIMGHEFSGEVVEVGDEVEHIRVGDYVSAETHIVCGHCYQCRTGNAHVCQNMRILGVDTDGSFAEYIVIPASNAFKNPKNIPPEVASIQEPLGNAAFTVLVEEVAGKTVAVLGSGPVGLLATAVARACGAALIISTDLSPYRLDLAKKAGADVVINVAEEDPVQRVMELTDGEGVDVVLEMSGAPVALQQGLKMVTTAGRVSILGLYSHDVPLDVTNDIVFKSVKVYGITGRKMYETWYTVSRLLSSGRLKVDDLITHKFALEDFEKGMELMDRKECGKVVLIPP